MLFLGDNKLKTDREMSFSQVFPTVIAGCKFDLSQAHIDKIIKRVLDIKATSTNPPNDYVYGWQWALSKEQMELFSDLIKLIDGKVRLWFKRMQYKDSSYMSGMYLTVGGKNSYIRKHVHSPREFLSGCFYIQTPGGNFCFNNPVEFLQAPPLINRDGMPPDWASFRHNIVPFPGLLLLFPPHLPHFTEPNPTDDLRISIAFNYRLL